MDLLAERRSFNGKDWKSKYLAFSYLLLLTLSAVAIIPAHANSRADPMDTIQTQETLEIKLKRLADKLEEQRQLYKIPGMAIAVVKNNEVVFQRGFGVKNIEKNLPVNASTIFPIGSITKPFTAVLTGLRVDEGVMDWDAPITKYLPEYLFIQEGKPLQITIRDALSHRSGYGRNDVLWSKETVPAIEVIKAATNTKPLAEYQTEFHYNNVMYLAVAMATAFDKRSDWSALLRERLLVPLGMLNTRSDYTKVIEDKRLATGYYWHELDNKFYVLPAQNLNNIVGASGMYSNANDMAKWVKFLLNQGQVNSEQLISETALQELFSPVIAISPSYSYGMGWNISEFKDETLLEHAGNGEGFSAQLAILPASNIGFVLLMNVSISPFQSSSINLIFETLLSETNESEETQDYSAYLGDYIANFEPHDNVAFTFKMHGKKPAVYVPGQTLYLLKNMDEQGKFYFEVADKVAISFNSDANNQVSSMNLHEPDGDFLLPKKAAKDEIIANSKIGEEGDNPALKGLIKLMQTEKQRQAFERLGSIEIIGTLLQEHSGVSGEFTIKMTDGLRFTISQDFGQFGYIETIVKPKSGMNKRLRHQYELAGKYLEQALREHPLHFIYWKRLYKDIHVNSVAENADTLEITLEGFDLPEATAIVDSATGETIKLEMTFIDPVWGQYPRSIAYSDYKNISGLNLPFTIVINDHETGKTILSVKNVVCDSCPTLTISNSSK